ncbi:MAG: pseudouridine synthase, partial [Bacteroidota bacterium]
MDRLSGASSLYLPSLKFPPATILEYLAARFLHVGMEIWRARMEAGKVIGGDGAAVTPETPYRPDSTIRYFREVESEELIPFQEEIIFRNEHILIADKPHFLPVVPTGPYVDECLLARLRRRTGLDELTPVHRLDRETAGLVLFSARRETRALYHRLFAD